MFLVLFFFCFLEEVVVKFVGGRVFYWVVCILGGRSCMVEGFRFDVWEWWLGVGVFE